MELLESGRRVWPNSAAHLIATVVVFAAGIWSIAKRAKRNHGCLDFRQHLTILIKKIPNAVPKVTLFVSSSGKDNETIMDGDSPGFWFFFLSLFLSLIRQKSALSVPFLSTLTNTPVCTRPLNTGFCFLLCMEGKMPQQQRRSINPFATD